MIFCEFDMPKDRDEACMQALQPHIDDGSVVVHEHRVMPDAPEGEVQPANLWRLTAYNSTSMQAVLAVLDG